MTWTHQRLPSAAGRRRWQRGKWAAVGGRKRATECWKRRIETWRAKQLQSIAKTDDRLRGVEGGVKVDEGGFSRCWRLKSEARHTESRTRAFASESRGASLADWVTLRHSPYFLHYLSIQLQLVLGNRELNSKLISYPGQLDCFIYKLTLFFNIFSLLYFFIFKGNTNSDLFPR